MNEPADRREERASLGFVLHACRSHLVSAAGFSALINVLYLTPTLYMMQVYDRVVPTGGLGTLFYVSIIALVALATLSLLEVFRGRILLRSGARLDRQLAGSIMSAILARADLSRFDRARTMRDFDTVRQTIGGPGVLAIFDAPWAPIYIVAAFLLSPWLGLLCVTAVTLMVALAWANEQATRRGVKNASEAAALGYARQDYVSSYAAEVRALGMREALTAKQLTERTVATDAQLRASFTQNNFATLARFFRLVLQSGALAVGALLTVKHVISPGATIAASLLLARALSPVEQIVGSWRSLASARQAWDRIAHILRSTTTPLTTRLPKPEGRLSFERVTVTTPGGERIALRDVSLKIEPGELIGIVGPSGAGKSTLLRAAAGSVLPESGVVRIDGAALKDWDPEHLAEHIGYMPQHCVLFAGTIKENISRFEGYLPGVDHEDIDEAAVAAAQLCGVHEAILRLPRGYDTPVGLGGDGLSSGQTQRIAIARALYRRPQVVILDEPNAYLDADAEHELLRCLGELKQRGVTVLLSAHRGALLGGADKLLQINDGFVVGFGGVAEMVASMRTAAARASESGASSPARPNETEPARRTG